MSFDRATAYVSCDVCDLESEPVELSRTADGGYSIEGAIREIERDGWIYDRSTGKLTCVDCLAEQAGLTETTTPAYQKGDYQ